MIPLIFHALGRTEYEPTWRAMQNFTARRHAGTPDEIWLTEHPPIYTLGLNKRGINPPLRNDIPLLETDRGGKITYHGPGQIVIYLLLDLKRRGLGVRQLVSRMESAIITLLAEHGVTAETRAGAPGVYVNGEKIAALGLRLKNGCCYHGLSLNVDMDLSPFAAIDPCGYQCLRVTRTRNLGIAATSEGIARQLLEILVAELETPATAI